MSKRSMQLQQRFNAQIEGGKKMEPMFHASAFSFPEWPVITTENPEVISLFNWGLIPHWVKTREDALKFRMNTLNAQCETAFEKPSFKFSISRKRCLVISTGFYEWRDFKGKKYPYFIRLRKEDIFCMAGIYENWTDKGSGEMFNTFSILTTKANTLMEQVHNIKKRMPVIIDPEMEKLWLNPVLEKPDYDKIFLPYNEEEMQAITISKLITSRKEDSNVEAVQDEFIYEELKSLNGLPDNNM